MQTVEPAGLIMAPSVIFAALCGPRRSLATANYVSGSEWSAGVTPAVFRGRFPALNRHDPGSLGEPTADPLSSYTQLKKVESFQTAEASFVLHLRFSAALQRRPIEFSHAFGAEINDNVSL